MDLEIHIKTRKSEAKVIKKAFGEYEVWVKSAPIKGAANNELIIILASYFNTKPYNLRIIKGLTSPIKIIKLCKLRYICDITGK